MVIHNLPLQPTSFIGRQYELREIARLLADPNCRLLTLLGPGGIGKTRLAIQFGQELANNTSSSLHSLKMQFRDGVSFVALQPLISSDFNLSALVDALRIQLAPDHNIEEQVLHHLRSKSILLILDNFEHLLDGVGLISRILANAAGVKMLVTSRAALNVQEEWLLTIKGMSYPQAVGSHDEQTHDAVRLFALHAQRARSDLSLERESETIGRICRLVEGMPLALELAATWVRSLAMEEIADEIVRGLDILESRSSNVAERHKTLRATLDYSWNLLSDKQQSVFKKLTVFRGGFTREAAEVVAGATRHTLAALVDHSWVRHEASSRYDIHELLRQYGEERLYESVEQTKQAHEAHCSYYADFMARREVEIKGAGAVSALREIENDLENVRMCWDWAVSHRQVIEIERGIFSLWHFYDTGVRFQEGEQAFAKAAYMLQSSLPDRYAELVLGKVLVRQGSLCYSLADYAKADTLLRKGLDILERHDAHVDWAICLLRLGMLLLQVDNRLAEANTYFQRSLSLLGQEHKFESSEVLQWMGHFYSFSGDRQKAEESYQRALMLGKQIGSIWAMAPVNANLSRLYAKQSDYSAALRYGRESLKQFKELGIAWGIGMVHRNLGIVALHLRRYRETQEHALQALVVDSEHHIAVHTLFTLLLVARLWAMQGRVEGAVELMSMQIENSQRSDYQRQCLELLTELEPSLSYEHFTAAVERGKVRNWASTVQEVIADLRISIDEPNLLPDALTEREIEVLRLVSEGCSNREIATKLVLSPGTIKWYVSHIMSKLEVSNRTQAAARARELNLIS